MSFLLVGSLPTMLAAALWSAPITEDVPRPHLFGTHALEAGEAPYPRWKGLRNIAAPYSLARLVRPLRKNSRTEQLAMVNGLVQTMIAYREDRDLWGREDYWAAPQETWIRRAGDCEDLALLKRAALLELGVPDRHLALIVGKQANGRDHAMLGVWHAGQWIMLDDADTPLRASEIVDFEPVISLIGQRTFVHGRDRLAPQPAAQKD